jgi:hypothetical protein
MKVKLGRVLHHFSQYDQLRGGMKGRRDRGEDEKEKQRDDEG